MSIRDDNLLKIVTKPVESEICMIGIKYQILFENQEVTMETQPINEIRVNTDEIIVDLYTDDIAWLGLNKLEVIASLIYEPYDDELP